MSTSFKIQQFLTLLQHCHKFFCFFHLPSELPMPHSFKYVPILVFPWFVIWWLRVYSESHLPSSIPCYLLHHTIWQQKSVVFPPDNRLGNHHHLLYRAPFVATWANNPSSVCHYDEIVVYLVILALWMQHHTHDGNFKSFLSMRYPSSEPTSLRPFDSC